MPSTQMIVRQHISAESATIFDYISDLTTHGAWAANDLAVTAVEDGEIYIGKKYQSHSTVRNLEFDAEMQVSEYEPPSRFAFSGHDKTGRFMHLFLVQPVSGGSLVTRQMKFELSLSQYLFYLLMYYPVRLPAARKALLRLKEQLEK